MGEFKAKESIRAFAPIRYIPGLDGVRAIAVILVILFHYTARFYPDLKIFGGELGFLARVLNLGWVGVDIFFVVSGFLIAKILSTKPIDSIDKYKTFVYRRALRLIPAYFVCLVFFLIVAMTVAPDSKVLKNQYLLWSFSANIESSFGDRSALEDNSFSMVHFWSLALEWHFYLLFPVIVALVGSICRAAILLVLIAIATRVVFHQIGMSDNALYSFTFCRIDSLAFGCMLAILPKRTFDARTQLLLAVGLTLFFFTEFTLAVSEGAFKLIAWLQIYGYSLIAVSIALIILGVINSPPESWLIRSLELPWLVTIGRSSYSLYIWHLVFFPSIYNFAKIQFSELPFQFGAAIFAGVCVTAFFGGLSYNFIEVPVLTKRSKLIENRSVGRSSIS